MNTNFFFNIRFNIDARLFFVSIIKYIYKFKKTLENSFI